jgi:hypothetical protein
MVLDDFSKTTYRISDLSGYTNQSEFVMDIDMVRILVSLDGKTPIKNIAQHTQVTSGRLRNSVEKLINLGIIEALENKPQVLDQVFLNFLSTSMARMVGPIASILIDDAMADLGHERASFPIQQVAELIDVLSLEIQQKEKRLAFQENMMQMLKEKGYLHV